MATQVVMPKLSPTMEEGQLARWLKNEGDKVSVGEPLAEIDTDKATMEAQALTSGVLRKILVPAGETVPLGQIIAIIGEPDEDISGLVAQAESDAAPAANKQQIEERVEAGQDGAQKELAQVVPGGARTQETIEGQPLKGDVGGQATTGAAQAQTTASDKAQATATQPTDGGNGQRTGGRVVVSPLAARMAADAGINLQTLAGSGPGGRIVKRDIEAAIKEGQQRPQAQAQAQAQPEQRAVETRAQQPAPQFQQPAAASASPYRDEPVSTMRATIARRLATSIGPVPHFFLTTEIEMDKVADLRQQINESDKENKVSVNDIIIKVAAVALVRHSQVNASFQDKVVRYYERADIGVAVAIEDGLITPVVRAAETKTIGQISREVRALAERARARKLQPEEYTGATFSISNLGMFGIDEFTAVINPPEGAILAVGAMQPKPVVRDGQIVVRQMMRVTMSCDHRVIDGATGAKFLQTFKQLLENPLLML
ncbi:MAG: pyruvate dehydrogenase complex dihydrolipoamide acetyltransferase [Acidobacteria bacterium]|nr:MAG: pyruvate dehydrogenase complex dihydrolipoamide acetyltransferase [Acidobacteriota bacterium]